MNFYFYFVDLIDVVKDQSATASDYVKEEGPCIFISRKTGRGPLSESWLHDYWRECKVTSLRVFLIGLFE